MKMGHNYMPLQTRIEFMAILRRWGHQPNLHVTSIIEEGILDQLLYAEDHATAVFCLPQVS